MKKAEFEGMAPEPEEVLEGKDLKTEQEREEPTRRPDQDAGGCGSLCWSKAVPRNRAPHRWFQEQLRLDDGAVS